MAVAFGSAGTYLAYASRTNSTLVAPASIADGDLLIAYLATAAAGGSPTPTAPAGWTGLTGSPISNTDPGSFNVKYSIFWKIAASEAGNYTFTHTAANSCGVVARYTGVDTVTPLSPTPTTNSGFGSTATATGFTTTAANTYIIFTEQDWGDNTTDTVVPTGTTPTFTERLDAVLLYIADGTLASAGATGNKSHTCNSAGTAASLWAAYLIGLNPSSGGVAPVTFNANPGSYALTGTPVALGRQIINIGAGPNDGTGDQLRVAFDKCNRNFADLYNADLAFLTTTAAATTYQPADADLTAISALTGTNTIYYRNGSSSWAAVNVSTGLAFSGGNLTATGGGGDVFKALPNTFTAANTFTKVQLVQPTNSSADGLTVTNTLGNSWQFYVDGANGGNLWLPGGTPFPFAIWSAGSILGLFKISGCSILGSTGTASQTAGYVGEFLAGTIVSGGALAAGTYTATATLSLPPGDWDVRGTVRVNGTAGAYMYINVYTSGGSSGSADNTQTGILTGLSDCWTSVGPFRVLQSTTVTWQLNIYMGTAGTLGTAQITARRRN